MHVGVSCPSTERPGRTLEGRRGQLGPCIWQSHPDFSESLAVSPRHRCTWLWEVQRCCCTLCSTPDASGPLRKTLVSLLIAGQWCEGHGGASRPFRQACCSGIWGCSGYLPTPPPTPPALSVSLQVCALLPNRVSLLVH